ncbi:MAG: cell division protein FtsA [Verrucomicrobiae bacterium]|nr:cell division protein FtsA [Verrucomicrobiae bacterium]
MGLFAREQIVVGLEVGTTKVCVVVAEVLENHELMIIGSALAPSRGVRKGEIVEMEAAVQSVQEAITRAEDETGVEIHTVYAAVTGGHIRSFNNRGSVLVTGDDGEISAQDIKEVLLNAKVVCMPVDHVIIHAIRQRFFVDGQDGIQNPVGMLGTRLEADVHVIHGLRTRLHNTLRCIRQVPLEIKSVVVNSLASALAVLTPEHQRQGALVIDMGGGVTDYIVFREGIVEHSGVLAVGGDHVTNDIALGLKVPINRAERLKVEHGSVLMPDTEEIIRYKREVGLPELELSRRQLCRIMNLRIEETLTLIRQDVQKRGLLDYLGAGVFLTGGCARTAGIQKLAEGVFGCPVTLAYSRVAPGTGTVMESPEYSTAVGLVRYAVSSQRDVAPMGGWSTRWNRMWQTAWDRIRTFF